MIEQFTHLEHRIRPFVSRVIPNKLLIAAFSRSRSTYLKGLADYAQKMPTYPVREYRQTVFKSNLIFRNDLANAAGFDKDGQLLEFNYKLGAGYAVVGTVLSESFAGNLKPSLLGKINPWVSLPNSKAAINSLGLPNSGVSKVVENIKKFKDKYSPEDFPIGASLMVHPAHEPQQQLDGILKSFELLAPFVEFFEINESCPNCEHDDSQSEPVSYTHLTLPTKRIV